MYSPTFSHVTSHAAPSQSTAMSLLPQMLWPIVLLEFTLLALVVGWYCFESIHRIHAQTETRAELIAQALEHRGQSTPVVEALSRMAESLAANRDVKEITVIDRSTMMIRNSNQANLVGQPINKHPNPILRQAMEKAISSSTTSRGSYLDNSYLYLVPTLIPTTTAGQTSLRGIIMVEIDITSQWTALKRDMLVFALTSGLLICTTILLIYGLLYRHIYRPLTSIRNTMQTYTHGNRNASAPALTSFEFNEVATSLNTMIRKQNENEEQLSSYANQMEMLTLDMETARDEALRANSMKSEFMATMSHEIRTPMNGVIGMTDLLLESGLNSKQAHYARTVQQSADALLSLIDDILDFSKIEAGKIELEKSPFNLTSTLESLGDMLAVKARDKALELVLHLDPDLPAMFVGDSARLRQVLINLVGNAIKFTHHGYVMLAV
ncbi:MAG: hypothetical protein DI585_06340, partial [Pseudomonas fluorescens]